MLFPTLKQISLPYFCILNDIWYDLFMFIWYTGWILECVREKKSANMKVVEAVI